MASVIDQMMERLAHPERYPKTQIDVSRAFGPPQTPAYPGTLHPRKCLICPTADWLSLDQRHPLVRPPS
jgi:hypothetical protein